MKEFNLLVECFNHFQHFLIGVKLLSLVKIQMLEADCFPHGLFGHRVSATFFVTAMG